MKINTQGPLYVIAFAAVTSAVFTAGIVTLQVATAARVERNEKMREYRALAALFAPAWRIADPAALSDQQVIDLVDARVDASQTVTDNAEQPPLAFRLYRAYADQAHKALVGVAIPVRGTGFWDLIEGRLALSADLKEVTGLVFVNQKETPGLGGRIEEPAFTDQFSKKVRGRQGREPLRADPPTAPGHPFLYIGRGSPTGPADPRYARSVDAITGATQTSLAVERFLNTDLRRFRRAMAAAHAAPAADRPGGGP